MKLHHLFATALLLSCGLAGKASAAESYDNCAGFIDALPVSIGT
ncbi:hypothetical protein [Agrilutibacter solisilvae]|nr:hypothetical protein [Lysobacter solisilvae]